jgi:hypothetical protein
MAVENTFDEEDLHNTHVRYRLIVCIINYMMIELTIVQGLRSVCYAHRLHYKNRTRVFRG